MPRFDDGIVNMSELIRAMAESLVNEIMDALGRRRLRGRQPAKRLPRAQARHKRGHYQPQDTEAALGNVLLRGPDQPILARGPRGEIGGFRDGRQRSVDQEGEARGAVHGHRPHERQSGVEDVLVAGRVGRRPTGTGFVGRQLPLHLARRHLHQAQGRRTRAVDRARDRHRHGDL